MPSPRLLFRQIEGVQRTAYRHLAAAGVLDANGYKDGEICRGAQILSDNITFKIGRTKEERATLLVFLVDHLANTPLYGPNGLKARTRLMEFRYDTP